MPEASGRHLETQSPRGEGEAERERERERGGGRKRGIDKTDRQAETHTA